MKLTLTTKEVAEALLPYVQSLFKNTITTLVISELDLSELEVNIALSNIPNELEDKEEHRPIKRKGKQSKKDEGEDEDEEIKVGTHYANLPQLTKEDHQKYIQILSLLNTNPLNKNRLAIQTIIDEASEDLLTVAEANKHFQDWKKYCQQQDEEKTKLKEANEPEDEPVQETVSDLLNEITDPVTKNEQSIAKPNHSLFSSQPNVQKSGDLFNSSGSNSNLFGSKRVI